MNTAGYEYESKQSLRVPKFSGRLSLLMLLETIGLSQPVFDTVASSIPLSHGFPGGATSPVASSHERWSDGGGYLGVTSCIVTWTVCLGC